MELTIKFLNQFNCNIPILQGPSENTIMLPARCEVFRQFKCYNPEVSEQNPLLVTPYEISKGVFVSRSIINSKNPILRVLNINSDQVIIKNSIMATENLHDYNIYSIDSPEMTDRQLKINSIIPKDIPKEIKHEFHKLCHKYTDIFAFENDKMTTNNFYSQQIRVSDNQPVYIKNYRLSPPEKEEINKQVQTLLDNKLIEPSQSNFNSPIILVPKKSPDGNKKWRMCIDFRMVNKKLVADKFPLPRIDDILDSLGRSKFFSVIDLFSGFHQIPIEENSRDLTSFSTDNGCYRWKVLPFGLNISPNSFSRMMQLAFAGATPLQCFLYMDDIIVIGCSLKHHLKNLTDVFEICRTHNLKINPLKCQFFRADVTYLGHRCTKDGVLPDNSKIQTMLNYPIPENKDSVKRFVAFSNYYRRFLKNFAQYARPLNQLTRRKAEFIWTQECQQSFDHIKNALIHPPILQYPDFKREFMLTVDASNYACGAVLSQISGDKDLPIAYASKSFTKGETNKSTIEKELTAIHWAIKHFRPYIYDSHFIVRTDHRPLVHLFKLKDPSSKLTRMRLDLEEHNFTIEYIKGKSNVVADALSRIHINEIKKLKPENKITVMTRSMNRKPLCLPEKSVMIPTKEPQIYEAISANEAQGIPQINGKIVETTQGPIITISVHPNFRSKNIFSFEVPIVNDKSQVFDTVLSKLIKNTDEFGITKVKIRNDDMLFQYFTVNEFKIHGNKLLKQLKIVIIDPPKPINDPKTQEELVKFFHNDPIYGGHTGKKRMNAKMKSAYTWKGMSKQIAKFVDKCHDCRINKPKPGNCENLTLTQTPQRAFQKVVIDTIGPLGRSENNNAYIVIMVCDLTKYLIQTATPSKEAKVVAKSIFYELILVHGPVDEILTDAGSEYVNQLFKELLSLYNIIHKQSTPYRHQTVGTVERNHRIFNEYLRSYMKDIINWEDFMRYFSYCYNTTPHTSFNTEYSPFELVFGKKPTKIPFLQENKIDPVYNFDNFALETKFKIQNAQSLAIDLLNKTKLNTKAQFDKKSKPLELNINDQVVLKNEARHKHEALFKGPYLVKEINNPNIVILDKNTNKTKTVHKNNIRKY